MSSTLLSVAGLSKRFGSKVVLDNAAFSVREGELVGLIGPNGAGKTTLFEVLAGFIPRNAGEVSLQGELFYLPDAICPWPDQRVEWALHFFEGLYRRNEMQTVAQALSLAPFLDSRIGSLSKGELKRFLLALGLLTPHPLLLLDEPFDGLDFRQARDVMALLRTYASRGRTLFLSIHQLSDAARVCDRLILLSGGRVVGQGTVAELREKAGLVDGGLEEIFLALT